MPESNPAASGTVRRLGAPGEPPAPSPYRLSLVFMAAQPRGQTLLDYEAEEIAILDATEGSGLDLAVEETGELTQLADTLARGQAAPDVLHLSCHGGFHDAEPALYLEKDTGDADPVGVRRIVAQPVLARARLLFLSVCHTADEEAPIAPLTQQLLQAGVPAVLGRLAVGGEGTAGRLLAFGLWDAWADPVDARTPCAAIDPLAHAVAGGLSEKERHKLAGLVAGPLLAHWRDQALPDPAAYELLRLGVLGGEADCILAGGELERIFEPPGRQDRQVVQ